MEYNIFCQEGYSKENQKKKVSLPQTIKKHLGFWAQML